MHPAKPKVGVRTARPDEIWHIDTTVIRLLDGSRTCLHAVIDNFSRRILAWRVADMFAPVNSLAVLVDASRRATGADRVPVVMADAGVENVNAEVDAHRDGHPAPHAGLHRAEVLEFHVESWRRSLKHQWLFLHPLDSVATVRRLVAFYVDEHNRVLPHSAFGGQTPDGMYFGTGSTVPADLKSGAAAARRVRREAKPSGLVRELPLNRWAA